MTTTPTVSTTVPSGRCFAQVNARIAGKKSTTIRSTTQTLGLIRLVTMRFTDPGTHRPPGSRSQVCKEPERSVVGQFEKGRS
jgi:hypothetical protein